jgi:tRNA (guanosine-2'-O-)-methyltransferase
VPPGDDTDWLAGYPPEQVIAALAPQLSPERAARIEAALDARVASLTVILENLHDPHNGAAALRSVEGFGLAELHVVEPLERFAFSSKVTQGCEKWVAIRRWPDFGACARALHRRGFALHAAVPEAPVAIEDLDVSRPAALVFGNEHAGLTGSSRAACDGSFRIPMAGFTRSFNLSVSVGIALHDCARRRRAALGAPGDLPGQERAILRARWYALSMDPRTAQAIVARRVSERTR